jgi:membrane protease YdiL (CAAX protease family)
MSDDALLPPPPPAPPAGESPPSPPPPAEGFGVAPAAVSQDTRPDSGSAPVRFNGWPGVPLTSISWGWRTTLGLAFLALAMNFSISALSGLPAVQRFTKAAIAGLPAVDRSAGLWASLLVLSLMTYAVLLAAALVLVKLKHAKMAPALGFRRARLWPVVGLVVAGVWIGFSVDIAYSIATAVFKIKMPDTNAQLLSSGAKSTFGLVAVFLLVGVVAPIAEEILFRGVVFSGLRDSWGEGWAIVVSSALFGVMHLQPLVMIPTAILGLLLAKVFSMTRSLWASIALHSAYNTTIMLFGLLVLRSTGKA